MSKKQKRQRDRWERLFPDMPRLVNQQVKWELCRAFARARRKVRFERLPKFFGLTVLEARYLEQLSRDEDTIFSSLVSPVERYLAEWEPCPDAEEMSDRSPKPSS